MGFVVLVDGSNISVVAVIFLTVKPESKITSNMFLERKELNL